MRDDHTHPLDDLHVVDLTTGIAGPYCTKLFADAGADVVKVEPPGGDPLRRYAATQPVPGGHNGPLFAFLNAGKRSIVAEPTSDRVDALLAGADLLVEDLAPDVLDVDALCARHPHLVVVSITPFGRRGPYAGRAATDLTLQAEAGAIKFKGRRDREPVVAGGRVAEVFGGLFAAPPALAAVLAARTTGRGDHIDVAIHDVLAVAGSNYLQVMHDLVGRPPITAPARYLDTPGIEQAADGLVGFNCNAGHMFQNFLLMVERPDLMDDPAIASAATRLAMGPEWQRIIDDWVGRRPVAEVIDTAAAFRVPVAPVHDAASIVHDEHLVDRGVFDEAADGSLRIRPPYRIDGCVLGTTAPAPTVGEHDSVVTPRTRAGGPTASPPPDHDPQSTAGPPLAGLKIVDLTSWWVGSLATQTLALLGAEVIHVEGVGHPDGMRLTGITYARTEDWWEWGHMFAAANAAKQGITLDLATETGRDLLDRLLGWADVLVENFAPRVAEAWGLTHEAVLARHPDLVYQRMPAHGLTGPWRDRPAFAQTIEPMSGMAAITGFPDGLPVSKGGIPDPVAGTHGAWALLVALAERRRRGTGVASEAVMLEAAVNVCAQPILEHHAYGRTMGRTGNRAAHAAPQGLYRARGDDEWLAVSVTDDAQWQALAAAIGGAVLAADHRYATAADRHARHGELDAILATWAAERDPVAAADEIARLGVPAAACRDPRTITEHPAYAARGLFVDVDHPVIGHHRVPGLPYRFRDRDLRPVTPAPTFGQHTFTVLHELLDLDVDEIRALTDHGIIATRPRGL